MIPNAWFYRLRDMSSPNNTSLSTLKHYPTNSFCYTPKVYSSPSTINRPLVPKHVLGSIYIRPTESTHTNQDLFLSPSSSCYESPLFESFNTCDCGVVSSSSADVKYELNEASSPKTVQDSSGYELVQEIELQMPPKIVTKSRRDMVTTKENVSIKIVKENINKNDNSRRKQRVSGVNTRCNSSNAQVCKRDVLHDQNKFSSSCCIVKSTFDPCKDLKESMMEMIVDYNIRASQDLEKLLAFYLSLNPNEYHDMIVKSFEEIWLTFDFVV
ncbi:hypothetical protein E3N88_35438 [Mikania micrantha]|uniref:Transcription repressor n=1 Tax=Mikania micrantha TaxID=192012 RepID=A0A5N6M131_9ASTR|nr:hypothetical protein E3N88_35438 [Mikania micrantha]